MRWCDGKCGRELALSAYRPGRKQCKDCENAKAKRRNRRRYLRSGDYKRAVQKRMREAYWLNPEAKRAKVAERALRVKLAGVA